MSWTGTLLALGWLGVVFIFLRWLWLRQDPPVPDGVKIFPMGRRWTYLIEDDRGMRASLTGYFTRGAAIRAAQAELDRLEKRIET